MNKSAKAILVTYAITLLVVGCDQLWKPTPPELTPEQSDAATQAMVEWFECEECEQGELKAVTEYGQAVVPVLSATVAEGASPASVELVRRELEKRYDELVAYQKTHPEVKLGSTKEEFVELYVGNFNAQYRTRAAQALGEIGGDEAERALESALAKVAREDERNSIKAALENLRATAAQ